MNKKFRSTVREFTATLFFVTVIVNITVTALNSITGIIARANDSADPHLHKLRDGYYDA